MSLSPLRRVIGKIEKDSPLRVCVLMSPHAPNLIQPIMRAAGILFFFFFPESKLMLSLNGLSERDADQIPSFIFGGDSRIDVLIADAAEDDRC